MTGYKSISDIKLPEIAEFAIAKLKENGFKAYAVGGIVRDALMGKEGGDTDITTSAFPDEVIKVFNGYEVLPTGLKHGTVTLVTGMGKAEITTFRRDGEYEDMRHPERVEFVGDIGEDLGRRDFTVNAIAYDPEEGIIDLYGGISDINARVLRAVGDPETRFREDALRILRALRFSSELGFGIEENTRLAAIKCVGLLSAVSKERVFAELDKTLKGKFVTDALMTCPEIVFAVIPELEKCYKFAQHSKWHKYDVYEHIARSVGEVPGLSELRWAMLLHDIGKPDCFFTRDGEGHFYGHGKVSAGIALRVLKRLKAPNKLINEVVWLVEYHDAPIKAGEFSVLKKLREYGEDRFYKMLEVKRADNLAQATELALNENNNISALRKIADELIARGACYSLKDLSISGDELCEIGFGGKEIGETLEDILNEVMAGNIPNDKESLLAWAKRRYEKRRK
ncbi:MAG: HD domain-containing protein [Clostridia bacterium]|nr:HD domain-containing protein [Clostridia bacterium]